MQTSARPRTLVLVMSDLVTEVAMLGPRGNELGPRQYVPVTTETASLWRAIGLLGELDRITCVGRDVNGLAARIARESQRPLRTMTWGQLQWSPMITGQGVELVVELVPQLRTTLFHDGREVPGLEIGRLRASKHRTYREYLAPRVCASKGPDVWSNRLARVVDELLAAWSPAALYLALTDELPVPDTLPDLARIVPAPTSYEGALAIWALDDSAGVSAVSRDR